MTMARSHETLRRVAILIATLDANDADAMLDQLPPGEAATVRSLMADLLDVDVTEEQAVIDEFLSHGLRDRATDAAHDGVELCLSESRRVSISSASDFDPATGDALTSAASPIFQWAEDAEPQELVKVIISERPQTIAVVLAQLPRLQALETLRLLPAASQSEVLRCWVKLDAIDADVLHEVDEHLRRKSAWCVGDGNQHPSGLKQVVELVSLADAPLRRRILDNLNLHPNSHGETQVSPPLFFEDLEYLNDAILTDVIRAARPETTVMALAYATESFVARVMQRLPPGEVKVLRRAIESLGPTRLADLEQAQRQWAAIAEQIIRRADAPDYSLPITVTG